MPFARDVLADTLDLLKLSLTNDERASCASAIAHISAADYDASTADGGIMHLPGSHSTNVMRVLCAVLMCSPATQDYVNIVVLCANRRSAGLFGLVVFNMLARLEHAKIVVHNCAQLTMFHRIGGRRAHVDLDVRSLCATTLGLTAADVVLVSHVPRADCNALGAIVAPLMLINDVRIVVQRAPIEDDLCAQMSSLGVDAD